MTSLLDDPAVAHYENDIRIAYGGESVCDDKARPAAHQAVKCTLNLEFGIGINARGRLVKYQHRRQAEHNASDTEQLLLTLTQTVVRYYCVEPMRQTADKSEAVCSLCGTENFIVGRVGLAECDIIAYSTALEPCVLEHHTVAAAKRMTRNLAYIVTVNRYLTLINIIEAHQQIYKRRFAAAGRTDYRNATSRLCV